MRFRFLFTSLFFASSVYSQVPVSTDQHVYDFIRHYGNSNYRSGLLIKGNWWHNDSVKTLPANVEDNEKLFSHEKWMGANDKEYYPIWRKPDSYWTSWLSKLNDQRLDSIVYDTSSHEVILSYVYNYTENLNAIYAGTYPVITQRELVENARARAHSYLRVLRGRIEDKDVVINLINGVPFSVQLNYYRIFRNGILPRDVSYVEATIDVRGQLEKIQIKWPVLQEIYGSTGDAISMNEAISQAQAMYSEIKEANQNDSVIQCLGATIIGMACGWEYLEDVGTLTPCFLFEARMNTADGDTSKCRISVPRMKKYLVNN